MHPRPLFLRCLVLAMLASTAFLIGVRPAFADDTEAREFAAYGYGDESARGMYGTISYFFPTSPARPLQPGSRLDLKYNWSPLLMPDRSTMTVVVNGLPLTSVRLAGPTGEERSLSVPLAINSDTGSGLFVELRFYLRLTNDQCEETQNPGLWARVSRRSVFMAQRGTSRDPLPVSSAPAVFIPPAFDPNSPVTLTAAGSDAAQLESLGQAAYAVGRWSAAAGREAAVRYAGSAPDGGPFVAVGAAPPPGQNLAPGEGLISLDPAVPALRLAGSSEGGLLTAARFLNRQDELAQAKTPALVVRSTTANRAPVPPWQEGAASFEQLGVGPRQLSGPGSHGLELAFTRPTGWQLREGSVLGLDLAFAPGLRSTSWVEVSVNGRVLGSRNLRGEDGRLSADFPLPADLLNGDLTGRIDPRLVLTLRFQLDSNDAACVQTSPEGASVTLLPTSAWRLVHQDFTGLDLARWPSPFLDDPRVGTLVVLPDAPTEEELDAAVTVVAGFGRWAWTEALTPPRLLTAGTVSTADRSNAHLVLIGNPERNPLWAEAGQRNREFTDAPTPPKEAQGDATLATLRLGPSPWRGERSLLAVEPPAARALTRLESLRQLEGRTAIVSTIPAQAVLGGAGAPVSTVLAPRVTQPLVSTPQIAAGVGLMALVAVAGVFLATRWRRARGR